MDLAFGIVSNNEVHLKKIVMRLRSYAKNYNYKLLIIETNLNNIECDGLSSRDSDIISKYVARKPDLSRIANIASARNALIEMYNDLPYNKGLLMVDAGEENVNIELKMEEILQESKGSSFKILSAMQVDGYYDQYALNYALKDIWKVPYILGINSWLLRTFLYFLYIYPRQRKMIRDGTKVFTAFGGAAWFPKQIAQKLKFRAVDGLCEHVFAQILLRLMYPEVSVTISESIRNGPISNRISVVAKLKRRLGL